MGRLQVDAQMFLKEMRERYGGEEFYSIKEHYPAGLSTLIVHKGSTAHTCKAYIGSSAVNNMQSNEGAAGGVAVNSAQQNQGSPMYSETGSLASVSPVGVKQTAATSQTKSPQVSHCESSLQQASTTPIKSQPTVPNVVSPFRRAASPMRGTVAVTPLKHPTLLPGTPVTAHIFSPKYKKIPPKPDLKILKPKDQQGIVLAWNVSVTSEHEDIASYQVYAYQGGNVPPSITYWKKVGDVKALPLPMACTLTQCVDGHKYHFSVRAVDIHSRVGPFSLPVSIVLAWD